MSKVIVSPVERWAGSVTLHDPLTLPQMAAFHAAFLRADDLRVNSKATNAMYYNALMPGIYACIKSFDLKNWPGIIPDLFPAKPLDDSAKMAAWLIDEVTKLATEADEAVPKESGQKPTAKPSDSITQTEAPSEAQS